MGSSPDPNRYDPDFAEVLSLMEQGLTPISIERPTTKSAINFKMMLYAYAEAWKKEGLKLSKDNPELSRACFDRARVMARYKLKTEGNHTICENRDAPNFPLSKITTGSERAPLLTAANMAEVKAELFKAPEPVHNPGVDMFEKVAKDAAARTAEAKRKMREAQRTPEHPELKLTTPPKAYAFERPKPLETDNRGSALSLPNPDPISSVASVRQEPSAPGTSRPEGSAEGPQEGNDPGDAGNGPTSLT